MRLGISTSCYYPEHLEFAVKNLVEHQVACIEVFVNTVSEFEPGFIRLLQGILQGGNTEVVSVHPFTSGMEFVLFFTDYQRRVDDGVEMYRKYFDVCSRLGGKYVVFHGVRRDIPCEDGVYFERFQLLYESARSMGVELLQENVARCKSGDPAFIQKMRKALGEQAHFVLDTKQCVRRGVELEQMRAVMGDALRHVHLSDCDVNHDCLPPGKGEGQIAELLHQLKKDGYTGAVLEEVYRQNYQDFDELIDAYHWMQRQAAARVL